MVFFKVLKCYKKMIFYIILYEIGSPSQQIFILKGKFPSYGLQSYCGWYGKMGKRTTARFLREFTMVPESSCGRLGQQPRDPVMAPSAGSVLSKGSAAICRVDSRPATVPYTPGRSSGSTHPL